MIKTWLLVKHLDSHKMGYERPCVDGDRPGWLVVVHESTVIRHLNDIIPKVCEDISFVHSRNISYALNPRQAIPAPEADKQGNLRLCWTIKSPQVINMATSKAKKEIL